METNYFTYEELTTTNTGLYNNPTSPVHLANLSNLWNYLNLLREKLGQPIVVNSAFRSPEVNRQVIKQYGGSKRSLHMQGRAADIWTHPFYMDKLFSLLEADRDKLSELIKHSTYYHIAL